MKKLHEMLTDYVIRKGMVEESDREMYEYAFQITVEVGLFAVVCFVIALYVNMLVEGLLFFIIFVPLRSYAGGLHMETFKSCFCLSCLAFSFVLLTVGYLEIPGLFSISFLLLLEFIVYTLSPVDNENREVDEEEDTWFKKKLRNFLFFDFCMAVFCLLLRKERYLLLIAATFLLIVISMLAGKSKLPHV